MANERNYTRQKDGTYKEVGMSAAMTRASGDNEGLQQVNFMQETKRLTALGIARASSIRKDLRTKVVSEYNDTLFKMPEDMERRGLGEASVVKSMTSGVKRERQDLLKTINSVYKESIANLESQGYTAQASEFMLAAQMSYAKSVQSLQGRVNRDLAYSQAMFQMGSAAAGMA